MISDFDRLRSLADDPGADPARAALELARLFQPDLQVAPWLDLIDEHGRALRERLSGRSDGIAAALGAYLFDELALAGNREDFQDPRNSFLNEVLSRRRGIPISLSVVYLALARRVGLDAEGIGFPYRFLVRVREGAMESIIDPFDGGRALAPDDLNALLRSAFGEGAPTVEARPALLRPVTQREILVRMLRNLKGVYQDSADSLNALTAVEAILALEPDLLEEVGDRGLIYRDLGHTSAAAQDLRRYIAGTPDAREAAKLQALLEEMEEAPTQLH